MVQHSSRQGNRTAAANQAAAADLESEGVVERMAIDLRMVCSAVRRLLENERAALNEADAAQGKHGDTMLALWQEVDRAVSEQPAGTPLAPELLAGANALEIPGADPLWIEYQKVLQGLASKFQDGTLTEQNVSDLAVRLAQGTPPGGASRLALVGGLFAQMARSVGGEKRLGELARQLGVEGLFADGLALLGSSGKDGAGREAGIRFLVSKSPFGKDPLMARSAALVLREALIEINRQQYSQS